MEFHNKYESDVNKIIANLCKWMKENDFDIESVSNTRLINSENKYEGRCVITSKDFKPNETIVEIPLKFLINYRTALRINELRLFFEWSAAKTKSNPQLKSLTRLDALYIFLAHQYIDENSQFFHFVNSMPKSYDSPEYIAKELIENLPDYLRNEINGRLSKLKSNHENILALLKAYFCENSETKIKALIDNLSFELFTWIFASVNTRCFHLDDLDVKDEWNPSYVDGLFGRLKRNLDERIYKNEVYEVNNMLCCLIPYLDFMNHCHSPNAFGDFNKEKQAFVLGTESCEKGSSDVLIRKGQQIYVQYGAHDNKNLFIEYGFILQDNCYDLFEFCKEDLEELLVKKEAIEDVWDQIVENNFSIDLTCREKEGPSWSLLKSLDFVCINNEVKKSKKSPKKLKLSNQDDVKYKEKTADLFMKLLRKYEIILKKSLSKFDSLAANNYEGNKYHLDLCRSICALHLNIINKNIEFTHSSWDSLF